MERIDMPILCRPEGISVPNGVLDRKAMRFGQFSRFKNSLPLVELALNLVDANGRRAGIRGPVRNGSTLTSAFVDVILQNNGNCRVSFCEYFRVHWVEYVNLPGQGFHIGGCGQFYDDKWRMIMLALPNEKIAYATMDNVVLTRDSAFCFRDDAGFTTDLPNPESLFNGNGGGTSSNGPMPALPISGAPWMLDDETLRILSVFRTDSWLALRLPEPEAKENRAEAKENEPEVKEKKAENPKKTAKRSTRKTAIKSLLYYDFRN